MADKPGDTVTPADRRSDEKVELPDIHNTRNPNAADVARATRPHMGDGSMRRFSQSHVNSQEASVEIDFGGYVALGETKLTEKQALDRQAHKQIHLSQPMRAENALHLIDVTLSTTARVLEMPFKHLAEKDAVNKDVANFIEHFRHDPNQFNKDAMKFGGKVLGIIDKPMSEEERAKMVGMLIPLFFMPGSKTPLPADKVRALKLEKMTEAELAEAGIARRIVKVYRGDDYAFEAVNSSGLRKSHITPEGDLMPADPTGQFGGKPVDIVNHINPSLDWKAKGHSPYTSFSESFKEVACSFGKTHISLDLKALRHDIARGAVKDVEIIDQTDIAAHIKMSSKGEIWKQHALECSRAEKEILIRGIIPKKYLHVEVK